MTKQRLSEDEKQYIFDNSEKLTDSEIAEWIGCSKSLVDRYRRQYGLKHRNKKWGQIDMAAIVALWNDTSVRSHSIAAQFGFTSVPCLHVFVTQKRREGYDFKYRGRGRK